MPPSRARLDAASRPHPTHAVGGTRKEPSMSPSPHHPHPPLHPVLRKIAARRTRVGGPAAPPAWASFWHGSTPQPARAPQPGPPAHLADLGGPRRLTPRELEVLHLVARGETDQRIADRLYLSRRTINCHVANILAKLEVRSRTAAVMTAARIGLL